MDSTPTPTPTPAPASPSASPAASPSAPAPAPEPASASSTSAAPVPSPAVESTRPPRFDASFELKKLGDCLSVHIAPFSKKLTQKKFLAKLKAAGIEADKAKKVPNKQWAMLRFKDTSQRLAALEALARSDILEEGHVGLSIPKGKRAREEVTADDPSAKRARKNAVEQCRPIEITTAPLCEMPYEEQLALKKKNLNKVLRNITTATIKSNQRSTPEWVQRLGPRPRGQLCCPMAEVVPSPVLERYRNKVQFTIGRDLLSDLCIGFAAGRAEHGVVHVADPSNCIIVSEAALAVRSKVQEMLSLPDLSQFEPYEKIANKGVWRQLCVRTFSTGDVVCILQVRPNDLSEEELEGMRQVLERWWKEHAPSQWALYLQYHAGLSNKEPDDCPVHLLTGPAHAYESVLGLRFRVSPKAFFQTNTEACNVLYSKVGEQCDLRADMTLLDICCGTGTIGLSLASRVHRVVGVDVIEESVEDARANAALNGIHNAEYVCARAEDVMQRMLDEHGSGSCFGIVDPPRAGLHGKVLKAIRACDAIQTLIYVSCKQSSLVDNAAVYQSPPRQRTH
eukprot:TRINITY_DN1696_c1_g2_i5.p1 TRINITY_DN1696_c1_g2~~TRINITY_DN1696_c1_g2_i5.p1  ORF type:complete len:565 (+),score=166.97 TRINITY_DN1696_c1_g2_i5:189-1883(+)